VSDNNRVETTIKFLLLLWGKKYFLKVKISQIGYNKIKGAKNATINRYT
jgi:hypothetical protein